MPEPEKIKVLLADDHAILRSGLKLYLETHNDFVIVGEAADGQEAIRLVEELHPDVVVMDVQMPVMDGLTATALITEQHPEIGVVILTNSITAEREQEAYQTGARAILPKAMPFDHIPKTIRQVVR